ncbi:MAG: 23S rRNA (uracil(1939)-C(5))-methyltransferase RlmD [Synergistaceae bacterium]|jgi:23S rRNA (uracil1939-C5)-methyltransferase|nr:23S rRNA (uracil(1939)-C(5))-methyltransferase RlmD [Synergistaceae bacterium]
MELKIEKMSSDGSGIARTEEGVVFVPGALPEETVEAEVVVRKKDFAVARLVALKEAHPRRIAPACPVFESCGSCQLQHAEYGLQTELKAGLVRDALARIGGFDLREEGFSGLECAPSPQIWGYRNKASFPVRKIRGKPVAGFYQAGSHRLVQLESCPVNAAPLNRHFGVLQRELPKLGMDAWSDREMKGTLRHIVLRAGLHTGETLFSLVVGSRLDTAKMKKIASLSGILKNVTTLTLNHNLRPGNVILGERTEVLRGDGLISERLDGWTLRYDTESFFQVNTDQSIRLYRHVQGLAAGKTLELYSGVGSMTCYLSEVGFVTAVEEWRGAVGLMKKNLEDNGIGNVRALCGRAEDVMTDLTGEYDSVVLDPPRSGCERRVLDKTGEFAPERIVYVSCNPSTLARDLKILTDGEKKTKYTVKSIRAFDMFPQTVHVETVVLLERRR